MMPNNTEGLNIYPDMGIVLDYFPVSCPSGIFTKMAERSLQEIEGARV